MTSPRALPAGLLALWVLVASAPAFAFNVFINGVKIERLEGQTFEKVTVKFDEKGDLRIDAPGYNVKVVEAGREAAPSQRYWLYVEQPPQGVGYELEVLVNGRLVRTVKSTEALVVAEVTSQLHVGKNSVLLSAKKVGKRGAAEAVLKAMIAEGTEGPNTVALGASQLKFEAKASQTETLSQDFVVTAK